MSIIVPQSPQQPAHAEARPERSLTGLWTLARMLSLYDLHHENADTRSWAHGNLIELYMLSLLPQIGGGKPSRKEAEKRALEHADQLIDIAGWDSFEVYSTRRQMLRYIEWYGAVAPAVMELNSIAERLYDRFPAAVEDRF